MPINTYKTLVAAIEGLAARGYDKTFLLSNGVAKCQETGEDFGPEELTIMEFHRLEGESNPDDTSVIYAIDTTGSCRGTIIDAYGSDAELGEFIRKVKMAPEAKI